jgi:hypothetical protein
VLVQPSLVGLAAIPWSPGSVYGMALDPAADLTTPPETLPFQRSALRQVEHPDLSPVLTHFCNRGPRRRNDRVPDEIHNMSASDRLAAILWDGHLRAFETFSQGPPAVCFTESTLRGFKFLVEKRAYHPWGLIVGRDSVYDAGGGPIWHARPAEYQRLADLDPGLRPWRVRLDHTSDWLEEREWRIVPEPVPGTLPGIPLSRLKLVGLLVGDPQWTGARLHDGRLRPPPSAADVPRYRWNQSSGELEYLPPLATRAASAGA